MKTNLRTHRMLQNAIVAGMLGLSASCATAPILSPTPVAAKQTAEQAVQTRLAAMGADMSTAHAPYLGAKFDAVEVNGHMYCTSCGTELNDAGRHKISNMMIQALQQLDQPGALNNTTSDPDAMTVGPMLALGAARLGAGASLNLSAQATTSVSQVLSQLATAATTPKQRTLLYNYPTDGQLPGMQYCPSISSYGCPGDYTYDQAVTWIKGNTEFRCCVANNVQVTDPPYCYEDAFVGQADTAVGSLADLQNADMLPSLYHCFPDCNETGTQEGNKGCQLDGVNICLEPPVNFGGQVLESSATDYGAGHNGPLGGVPVTLTGSMNGTISLTSNGSGNYSGQYQPPSTPTAKAQDFGMTVIGGPNGPLVFYTDATMQLAEDPAGAPAANGGKFSVTASANGGSATTNNGYTLSTGTPTFLSVPRNSAGGNSTLTVSGVDSPRFTWFGDGALSLTSSTPAGTTANNRMLVKMMHKWIDVAVTLQVPAGANGSDVQLNAMDPALVQYTGQTGSYPDAARFGLPTAINAAGASVAQGNPLAPNVLHMWVESGSRIATGSAPYHQTVVIHADGPGVFSQGTAANEEITIDDAARISGTINKTIIMVAKDAK